MWLGDVRPDEGHGPRGESESGCCKLKGADFFSVFQGSIQ